MWEVAAKDTQHTTGTCRGALKRFHKTQAEQFDHENKKIKSLFLTTHHQRLRAQTVENKQHKQQLQTRTTQIQNQLQTNTKWTSNKYNQIESSATSETVLVAPKAFNIVHTNSTNTNTTTTTRVQFVARMKSNVHF
jgi:hypothetical protein